VSYDYTLILMFLIEENLSENSSLYGGRWTRYTGDFKRSAKEKPIR